MADYVQIAYAAALAHNPPLTAADVAAMDANATPDGYHQIAALCGVTLSADGSSPTDFFYENIRNAVVNELLADEADLALYEQMEAYQQKLGGA